MLLSILFSFTDNFGQNFIKAIPVNIMFHMGITKMASFTSTLTQRQEFTRVAFSRRQLCRTPLQVIGTQAVGRKDITNEVFLIHSHRAFCELAIRIDKERMPKTGITFCLDKMQVEYVLSTAKPIAHNSLVDFNQLKSILADIRSRLGITSKQRICVAQNVRLVAPPR